MTPTSSTGFKRIVAASIVASGLALGGWSPAAHANCWVEAGEQFGIDPLLLYAIATVESSLNPRALRWNRNGSFDVGLMQINSTHLPRLMKAGITRERLLAEPCTTVKTGAEILAGFVKRHGYTWNAVGAYNAGSAPGRVTQRKAYVTKVWRTYRQLQQPNREHPAWVRQQQQQTVSKP